MRKTLFATAIMLLCSLAVMASTPSGQSGSHMSEFKLQSGESQTDMGRSNLTSFKELTSDAEKERLARKGIKLNHFFNTPETTDGHIQPANAPMREGEERYNLTVNLKYDKEEVARVSNCVAYPNYASGFWFRNEWSFESQPDKVNFNLPEGNYDIEVTMYTADMNFILLTASDIEVINDCEILLDAAEATIDIVWDPLMPDGTTPCTDIVVYEPDTFDVVEDIPGNVLAVFNKLNIYNKNFEIKSAFRINTITYFVGDEKHVEGLGNIKTNSSDKYLFFLDKQVIGRDGGFIIPLTADALESKIVTNNINDYITLKPEFASTPHEPEQLITEEEPEICEFNRDKVFCLKYASVLDGRLDGYAGFAFSNLTEDIHNMIHVCQDPKIKNFYTVMPIPTLAEDWDANNSMVGLPIYVSSTQTFVSALNNTGYFDKYLHLPDERNIYLSNVINPWFSFDEIKPHVWNYGCPILVFSTNGSDEINTCDFSYIGRLGERRGTDLLTAKARVMVDDAIPSEEVLENLQWGELPSEGKFDFEFIDTNVAIDGIPGKNVCRVGFDMSRSDWQPPTLQIVRFVDTDDNFIDRYATGEEGVIEFYGGDFTSQSNPETYVGWYTEEPAAEVKVEYAPYGTDTFLPLEVENIAERDFMPGFGTYYRGSLSGVDRKSENGWFDVRITLIDAEGNFQEQTLSPAFKIEGSVGVETIESKVTEIGRYNLNGKAITADYEGIGIIRYSDGSIKKIVVKK